MIHLFFCLSRTIRARHQKIDLSTSQQKPNASALKKPSYAECTLTASRRLHTFVSRVRDARAASYSAATRAIQFGPQSLRAESHPRFCGLCFVEWRCDEVISCKYSGLYGMVLLKIQTRDPPV